ncbi:MAG TPA: phosphoribosylanthranilate isomerase, partial [Anaerolineae bacterium]|nr:phosphoribosylanthranilate isomerase [Anaerolineae bacterium]
MTRVKICGITNLEDARVAVEVGADLVGFIFYEPSPRYVKPELVRSIVAAVKQESRKGSRESGGEDVPRSTSPIICVGVFVNETPETVRQVLDFCRLDAAQLHGEESPAEVASFAGIAYKALRPKSVAEAYPLAAAYTRLTEQAAGNRQQEAQSAISNEQLTINKKQETNPTLQSSNPPTLQPSSLPAFQPSILPTLLLDAYHPDLYGGTGHLV